MKKDSAHAVMQAAETVHDEMVELRLQCYPFLHKSFSIAFAC